MNTHEKKRHFVSLVYKQPTILMLITEKCTHIYGSVHFLPIHATYLARVSLRNQCVRYNNNVFIVYYSFYSQRYLRDAVDLRIVVIVALLRR